MRRRIPEIFAFLALVSLVGVMLLGDLSESSRLIVKHGPVIDRVNATRVMAGLLLVEIAAGYAALWLRQQRFLRELDQ